MPGGWVESNRGARLPAGWKATAKRVIERDGGICYLCGQPGADTADHVQAGDNHDLSNLAAVHDRNYPHCHRKKSSAEGNTARWQHKTARPREQHPGLMA